MTLAADFNTLFGTSIQGIDVKWSNTVAATENSVASSMTLKMEMTLNLYNMLDLNTGASAAIDAAASAKPILMFYLMFLNNDSNSNNIATLPYDAFVGLLQFQPTGASTDPTVDPNWTCLSTSGAASGAVTLAYGNDWTGDSAGAVVNKDTTNNNEYTCNTNLNTWGTCTEVITLANAKQCAKLTVEYQRAYQLLNGAAAATGSLEDVDLDFSQFQVKAGWNLITSGTDISDSAAVVLSTNYFDLTDSTTASFGNEAVDFKRFKQAEPEYVFLSAHNTVYMGATALAALVTSSIF